MRLRFFLPALALPALLVACGSGPNLAQDQAAVDHWQAAVNADTNLVQMGYEAQTDHASFGMPGPTKVEDAAFYRLPGERFHLQVAKDQLQRDEGH